MMVEKSDILQRKSYCLVQTTVFIFGIKTTKKYNPHFIICCDSVGILSAVEGMQH